MNLAIHLQNTEHDADAIAQALQHTDIHVEIEDGKVVLKSGTLVPARNFDVAESAVVYATWQRINEVIAIINGAARIEGGALHEVALTGVAYEDAWGNWQHLPNIARMRAVGPSLRANPPDPSELIWIGLHDRAAAKGLRLASRDLDWCNLYRIFEVVVDDVQESGIVTARWATKSEIETFRTSANNESVTGDDSRHGGSSMGVPKKTMNLPDAQHLIKRILRLWLTSKTARRASAAEP